MRVMAHGIRRILGILILVAIAVIAFGFAVEWLWNHLMPAIFGLHAISYWQALGLLVLGRILFGGFRGGHAGRGNWRARMIRRWEDMTPEERDKFRAGMRGGCDPLGTSEPAPKV